MDFPGVKGTYSAHKIVAISITVESRIVLQFKKSVSVRKQ